MLILSSIQISIMTDDSCCCWHHLRIHVHMSSVGSLVLFGKRKLTLHRIRYDLVIVVLMMMMMMMLDEWMLISLISLDLSTRRKIDTIDTACACALENLFLIRQPTKKPLTVSLLASRQTFTRGSITEFLERRLWDLLIKRLRNYSLWSRKNRTSYSDIRSFYYRSREL